MTHMPPPIRTFARLLHRRLPQLRDESGQVILILAVALILLLGISGLVMDVGNWYHVQRQAQAVADASALAAAQALPDATGAATASALDYASRNHGVLAAGDITYASAYRPNDTVTVQVRRTEPTVFAKLFGFDTVSIKTTATARASNLLQAEFAAPFAIVNTQPELAGPGCPCLHVPTTLDLEKIGPGGFKIINIDGAHGGNQGPNTIADWIQYGYDGSMALGWYNSMPGAKFNSSQVKNALDARLNTDLLFPIYDDVSGSGANLQYHVIGWAVFEPTGYDFHGNGGSIDGSFDHVTWQGLGGPGGVSDGAISVSLVN
jgi:Flp pilus assembly protein TadG